MSAVKSNSMLKIIALAAFLVLAVIMLKTCGSEKKTYTQPASEVMSQRFANMDITDEELEALGAETDTTEETIKTLIHLVKTQRKDTRTLIAENKSLQAKNAQLENMEKRISENSEKKVEVALAELEEQFQERISTAERNAEKGSRNIFNQMSSRLESISKSPAPLPSIASQQGEDIPVGLGLNAIPQTNLLPDIVWIEPLENMGVKYDENGNAVVPINGRSLEQKQHGLLPDDSKLFAKKGGRPSPATAFGSGAALDEVPGVDKYYTVPQNATLIGSVSMTSLIGRVPLGGKVIDPFPFKLIVGKENLAANGLKIPNVSGMIFSGTATGDLTLRCVTGKLTSVTFVFDDGTIRTLPEMGESGGALGALGGGSHSLGWISDKYGVPCIRGQLKTNAPSYLAQLIGLSTVSAYANASAASETSTGVSPQGAVDSVTGSKSDYARDKAVSEGVDSVVDWLRLRQSQQFDAIYVAPETEVAIHIDEELQIDYDNNGRKLNHHVYNIHQDHLD